MQTDPQYMLSYIRAIRGGLVFDNMSTAEQWGTVASIVQADLMNSHYHWHCMVEECQNVRKTFQDSNVLLRPGRVLSDSPNLAFASLQKVIGTTDSNMAFALGSMLPTLRALSERCKLIGNATGKVDCLEKEVRDPTMDCDRLHWALKVLSKPTWTKKAPEPDRCVYFQMIRHVLETTSRDCWKRLDDRFHNMLANLASVDELAGVLEYNQIGVSVPEIKAMEAAGQARLYWQLPADGETIISTDKSSDYRLGAHLRMFSESPWPGGKKNRAWFEKASKSRDHLGRFWQSLRKEQKRILEARGLGGAQLDACISRTAFDESPHYIAELGKEERACEQMTLVEQEELEAIALANQRSLLATAAWDESDQTGPVRRKQTKVKAQRQATESAAALTDRLARIDLHCMNGAFQSKTEPELVPEQPPVAVNKHSLGVFHLMFPADPASAQGSVRWQRLVHAMTDAGFVATEAGGSEVHFAHCGGQGSIKFHRPHPEPVVENDKLQIMGKRMWKWFGWNRDVFVLREKTSAAGI